MFGSSRDSLARLKVSLDARRGQADLATLCSDLLSVADLLEREKTLRVTLADSGQASGARAGMVGSLLGQRISAAAIDVLTETVTQRWSTDADLVDAVEQLGAQAGFLAAEADGTLDRAEEEIFRFGRAVDASADLQMNLTDPAVPPQAKSGLVRQLLAGRTAPVTQALLEHLAGHLRGRRVDSAVSTLSELAAAQRQQIVAEVRVAIDLDADQRARLVSALTRLRGRPVRLNVAVDASVLGGASVRIGDEIIDGTVASRLEQARRAMTIPH